VKDKDALEGATAGANLLKRMITREEERAFRSEILDVIAKLRARRNPNVLCSELIVKMKHLEALKKRPAPLAMPVIPAPGAAPLAAAPPGPPPPRERRIESFKRWVPYCTETCELDRDLFTRVSALPLVKSYSPRGMRIEPLLRFTPFYYSCQEQRYDRFGYNALAFLWSESTLGKVRLMVTEGTMREAGLDDRDLEEVRARLKRWMH